MTTPPQPNTQGVSDAALIEFSRIKLWFFRDLVDAQRKALFLLCGFSDAVTHGELDTHSAQLRALRHALRIDAAHELQQPVAYLLDSEDPRDRAASTCNIVAETWREAGFTVVELTRISK